MTDDRIHRLERELEALRAENARLQQQAEALADTNVYAAELVAALEEAQEREDRLRRRGEELALQTRLDHVLQEEHRESMVLLRVAGELEATDGLALATAIRIREPDGTAQTQRALAALPLAAPAALAAGEPLVVPIQAGGVVLGALECTPTAPTAEWCERWLPFLWSVGNQVGVALRRLRAEHDNERMNAELISARDEALEASRTKSAFLANMSHELRTPMNAIIGYSEMLIEEADALAPEEFVPDLLKIQAAGKHLLSLINDVLDLSKLEAGKMTMYLEPFRVRQVLDEVVATVQPLVAKNRNSLAVECPDDIGTMVADVTKFRQTLFNLLSNASKFTEGGVITLSVSAGVRDGADQLVFAVRDSGIGMTPEQLANLFQAFTQADNSTTRKYGGTGLGLTISRRFCQMMGGDIRVSSEPGVGSTFTIELPRVVRSPDDPLVEVTASEAPPPIPTGGAPVRGTILAIDDNREALEIIQRSLTRDGYRVVTATSGEAGIALARTERPDVITLDVMMPQMNGWDVLAALKADAALADIPVVLLSVVENKEIGLALGATDCLTKPIDWTRLDSLLDRLTAAAAGNHVLVVEDDPASSELVRRLLEKDGWKVETAANGQQGLDRVQANRPALVVLDLMMPVMDGFTFSERLRMLPGCEDLPVVVLTSKSLTPDDHRRLNGRVADIMTKSAYRRSDLLATVRRLTGHAPDDAGTDAPATGSPAD